MSYDPGDEWTPELTVKNPAGVLTAATVSLSVLSPSGTVTAPTVITGTTGVYTATVPLTEAGQWKATWTVSGAVVGVEAQSIYVRRFGGIIGVTDVRARALNKTLTNDDPEIETMIDAALAYYDRNVGYLTTKTQRFSGSPGSRIVLPVTATGVTAVAYTDGTTVDVSDLVFDSDSQMLDWEYGTTGYFTYGTRNVAVTYTTAMPPDHREIVIADVAGYFSATQRGGGAGPSFAGEGYEAPFTVAAGVITLWPRVDNLARAVNPGIA